MHWPEIETLAATIGDEAASVSTFRPAELPGAATTRVGLPTAHLSTDGGDVEPSPEAPLAGHSEGFRILGKIGQGGMGVVYRAVQSSLQREVALKQATGSGVRAAALFFSEAQITGSLEHANIVPVHVLGQTPGGAPLLAMKLVRGTSWGGLLSSLPAEGPELERHLRILISVCNGVAFAHREGFIHRDLKPENVMVAEFGQVFVMDWGLAAGLDPERCRRQGVLHAAVLCAPAGTPAYMAPELARGDGPGQGVHTDVYLLGACLHEVLTGRRRHQGAAPDTIRDVLQRAVDSPPFDYGASVPEELAAIANRATARDPAQRFPSVEDLRGAVEAFLEHRQAHLLTEKGRHHLQALRDLVGSPASAGADTQSSGIESRAASIHGAHAEARYAFQHALDVWPEARLAREGLLACNRLLLEHALATEDLALCARIAPDCGDEGAGARVEALRSRLQAREQELRALRDAARRQDWSAVAAPLGSTFVAAGLIGSGSLLLTRVLFARGTPGMAGALFVLWIVVAAGLGVVAAVKLRRAGVPDSLVSSQMLGLWGAVAVGCLAAGVTNHLHGLPPFHDSNYSALMIGIGFAAMAHEARRWLLLPAALFFAGGIAMAAVPSYNLEVFAGLWLLGIGGVGVAIRAGVRIDAGDDRPSPSS